MYEPIAVDIPLMQGDLIDDCPIFGLETSAAGVDLNASPKRWQERIVVLTQACDLAQNKVDRALVAVVHPAQDLVDRGFLKASLIRNQIRRFWSTVGISCRLPLNPLPCPNRLWICTISTPFPASSSIT